MGKLFLIQTGRTVWEAQERVETVTGQPLTPEGAGEVAVAGRQLVNQEIETVYSGDGESERETAAILAGELGAKARTAADLRELDYGLWQGLTISEIKRRQPKVYHQWQESPASVRPPGGESLAELRVRLEEALRAILKRHRGHSALVVLRPVALALARCILTGQDDSQLWIHHDPRLTWYSFDTETALR